MMKAMTRKQRGVSFSGFMVVVVIFILVAIGGMKIIPPYMQNKEIVSLFDAITQDPAMKTESTYNIRLSYGRRASIDNITAIKAEDVDVNKENGKLTLSANYTVKQPLFGNASLLLEFNPSSSSN